MGTLQNRVYASMVVFCCGSILFLGRPVSPHVSLPIESTKKRRRFHQKGKFIEEVTKEASGKENCQDQEGPPCGFSSKVAEPPVRAGTTMSHSVSSP